MDYIPPRNDKPRIEIKSELKDALGEIINNKKRMRDIRMRYGKPEPRMQISPRMQWMGDNES